MDNSLRLVVERQVRRVRRRLFARSVLHALVLSWSAALLALTLWLLIVPFVLPGAGDALRWSIICAVLGIGTAAGIVAGWRRTPNLVASALALDEQFALRERVTTLLMLPADMASSPAGRALLEDVVPRVEKLHVRTGFPLLPSWRLQLLPAGAMVLALAAFFFAPWLSSFHFTALASTTTAPERKVNAQEVQQQLDNLRKVANDQKNLDVEKSKEIKELFKEWDRLVNKPVDSNNPEQVRERLAEMRNLEQKMKERAHDLKAQAQQHDVLKKLLERLGEDGRRLKEGPAKDFEDALMKGDFRKAKQALDKLSQQLKENKLTAQQRKEVAEQFKQLQEKIKRVQEKDEKMKQLKKDLAEGRINKEQFKREMEKMKELQELSNLIGECKECMSGDPDQAAAALAKMAKQFEQEELSQQELDEILENMRALNEAANGVGDALGEGDENGLGQGGPPGGRRPIDPDDPDTRPINQRQKAQVNRHSQQRITGFTSGGNFNKIPAHEVAGKFRQARQDAPEAIERQNIPEDAAGIARGYFKKLGGQR